MKKSRNTLFLSSLFIASLTISPTILAESQGKTTTSNEAKAQIQSGTESRAKEALKASKPAVSKEQDKANKEAISKKAQTQAELLEEINKGVVEGFENVVKASKFIQENKTKEAIKALQDATGKFDIALTANPKLGLVPLTSTVQIKELLTTPELIKAQVKLAQNFLKDSKVQAARAVLAPMQDELVTRTTLLPMRTYPDAIKLATKMLIDGKKDAAEATLVTALSTFMEEVSVIPLSLLRVETMVLTASELDKEKEKDKVLTLLGASEEQLKVAIALGYTTKDSALYEDLLTQIKAIKKEITGGNIVEKLYVKLKDSIKDLIDKESKQKAEKSKQDK